MKALALQSTSPISPAKKPKAAASPVVVSPYFDQPVSTIDYPVIQRKCACGGGCPNCQEHAPHPNIQTKLAIGTPGDQYEQEAERVADQVLAMPTHSEVSGTPPRIQRYTAQANAQNDAAPASVDHVLTGSGRPLDPALRQDMEQRFGHDFSQVRVHSGGGAAQSARDINANAYTVGSNVVFGTGQWAPETREGRRLIAHELTHVVQQSGSDRIRIDSNATRAGISLPKTHAVRRQQAVDPALFQIEGGQYSPQEKKYAAQHRAGLVLTTSVIGKQEQKVSSHAPAPIFVSKELMRFEAGRLGEFVSDYNDFTQYFDEVLHAIGRLRDLLSTGAPEAPTEMTPAQRRALRPTDNTQPSLLKKEVYQRWRTTQAEYATKGDLPSGFVFDVVQIGREVERARQEFWEAKGLLSQTIAEGKRLDKPKYEALELKITDAVSIVEASAGGPVGAAVAVGSFLVDQLQGAVQRRHEYDAKMQEFGNAVKDTNEKLINHFEALKGAGATYWAKLTEHRTAIQKRDNKRIGSRMEAAHLGQAIADPSESRDPALAEVRMPVLVADAWHALASIGPSALMKLSKVLAGNGVVVRASKRDWGWRDDPMGLADITQIRLAWQRAQSWELVLTRQEVEEWVAMNKLWEETFLKFNV